MKEEFKPRPSLSCQGASFPGRRGVLLLALLLVPLALGAWRDISGNTINPRYVARIKDGQTTKQQILVLFGEPQQVERTPAGLVFRYVSYKDAPPEQFDKQGHVVDEPSITPYYLDENKNVKRVPKMKREGKIPRSTLVIRFKSDGQTVLSHEYQEY
jgi:outer membrane protein assembly factor BamE (lipoprotein component of BamABCDE complex)